MGAIVGYLTTLLEKVHSRKFVLLVALGGVGYYMVDAGKLEGMIYFITMAAMVCVYCLIQGSLDKDDSTTKAAALVPVEKPKEGE